MRIIEPGHPARHSRGRSKRPLVISTAAVVFVLILAIAFLVFTKTIHAPGEDQAIQENSQGQSSETEQADDKPKTLKTFSGVEFKNLYNSFAYPNTQEITTPLPITGNVAADDRIRAIAIGRGYMLRSVPVAPLTQVDDFLLQQRAVEPWRLLEAAAKAEGVNLGAVSTFRSPDEQRGIFMAQLRASGATPASVAAGQSDDEVDMILRVYSIPGYSRHHTGYTLDLECGGSGLDSFINTPCFAWLSKNNYENAKKFGWIPSYPDGAGNQGPNPEQWEYVWVGTDVLYE